MKSPSAFFIFFILGLQLTSAVGLNGSPEASVTETAAPSSFSTASASDSASTASSVSLAQGLTINGTPEGTTFATPTQDGYNTTQDGASNKTGEMKPLNNGTQDSATSRPSAPEGDAHQPVVEEDTTAATVASNTIAVGKKNPGPRGAPHSSTGYLIVGILLFVIIFFLFVIYILHKKSKRYSFDLHSKTGEEASIPLNALDQEGSFQPTLPKEDGPASDECSQEDNITNNITVVGSTPNGSTSETPGPTRDHDNENLAKPPSEDSFGSQVPLSPKDEPGTFTLDLNDIDLNRSNHTSLESLGEQQNENNNNTSAEDTPGQDTVQADLSEDFAEVHLDETA